MAANTGLRKSRIIAWTVLSVLLLAWIKWISGSDSSSRPAWRDWRTDKTLSVTPIFSSDQLRLERHMVANDKHGVQDWLWIDEPDSVNVLIQSSDGTFMVFLQTKYGINGSTLATLGGDVEPGETPLEAAKRELREEASMVAAEWDVLGSFVVNANRGEGAVHLFLASSCTEVPPDPNYKDTDLETREPIYVSVEQLREHVLRGDFQEVKWSATVALALLKLTG